MFCSTNFVTKSQLQQAVESGEPVILYSPTLGVPAVNGTETVEGPWPAAERGHKLREPRNKRDTSEVLVPIKGWRAKVQVRDMRVTAVLA